MSDLVTNAEVLAAWPGFSKLDSGEQAALITQASDAVEGWCQRVFAVTTYTELLSGANLPRVWLSHRPVVSITSVTVNGDAIDNSTGVGWQFDPDTGELLRGWNQDNRRFNPWFPSGFRNITVVYSAGFSPIPPRVKRATILTVKNLAEAMRTSVGPIQSEKIGDYQYTLAAPSFQAVPAIAAGLLANYVLDPIL